MESLRSKNHSSPRRSGTSRHPRRQEGQAQSSVIRASIKWPLVHLSRLGFVPATDSLIGCPVPKLLPGIISSSSPSLTFHTVCYPNPYASLIPAPTTLGCPPVCAPIFPEEQKLALCSTHGGRPSQVRSMNGPGPPRDQNPKPQVSGTVKGCL